MRSQCLIVIITAAISISGVWWVGALIGGVSAGMVYEYLFMKRKNARYQSCHLIMRTPPSTLPHLLSSPLSQAERCTINIWRQPQGKEDPVGAPSIFTFLTSFPPK
jgi:hypothetical protein